MKRKIAILFLAAAVSVSAAACSKGLLTTDDVLGSYYGAADYNKTINMTVDYSFTDDDGSSQNHSESLIKIRGNKMSFDTTSTVSATTESEDITNSISAYLDNDKLYYEVNGSKIKEACTVKQAMYMLGIDYALIDESYCDNIDISVEKGVTTTVFSINSDMVISNWQDTFFTLYNGIGITESQIQSVDNCTIITSTKDDKLLSYEINFSGDIADGDGSVRGDYKIHMDFSDYGTTMVTAFDNLDEYIEQSEAGYTEEDLSNYTEISPEDLTVLE